MAGFLEVLTVAFLAQLAALPGEKGQFIVAGLSTRFHPLTVVSAAGCAFAGWTALEILFGNALSELLPGVALDVLTAGMFLLFAILLIRSVPPTETSRPTAPAKSDGASGADGSEVPAGASVIDGDGSLDVSVVGRQVPTRFGPFLPIFALMAAGEFGDKTQIVTFGLAAQFGAHPGIWVGEMLAIVPVTLANAYFFNRFAGRFDRRTAHVVAAGVFLVFFADAVLAIVTGVSIWETVVGGVSEAILGAGGGAGP